MTLIAGWQITCPCCANTLLVLPSEGEAVPLVIRDSRTPRVTPAGRILTRRETQVLQLAARGWPNERIATELGVGGKTVKSHISSIISKLGVTNRTGAVAEGLRLTLIQMPEETE